MGVWENLTVFDKSKNVYTLGLSNTTPRYLSKEIENMCSQKGLYKNVPSSIIKNSKKKKSTDVENKLRLPRGEGSGTN